MVGKYLRRGGVGDISYIIKKTPPNVGTRLRERAGITKNIETSTKRRKNRKHIKNVAKNIENTTKESRDSVKYGR